MDLKKLNDCITFIAFVAIGAGLWDFVCVVVDKFLKKGKSDDDV